MGPSGSGSVGREVVPSAGDGNGRWAIRWASPYPWSAHGRANRNLATLDGEFVCHPPGFQVPTEWRPARPRPFLTGITTAVRRSGRGIGRGGLVGRGRGGEGEGQR